MKIKHGWHMLAIPELVMQTQVDPYGSLVSKLAHLMSFRNMRDADSQNLGGHQLRNSNQS